VDNGSDIPPPETSENTIVIADPMVTEVFNKPIALNLGISVATGDVFTFLDADAIVGRKWMKQAARLSDRSITRLCYRVRYVPKDALLDMEQSDDRESLVSGWFDRYDELGLSYEAYGDVEEGYHKYPDKCFPVFGNSQFSMTRRMLGDLRYNEDYAGANFEDLWFIREVFRRRKPYRGEIVTEAEKAMLHIRSTRDSVWGNMTRMAANEKRFRNS
jgi:glycosyltransferase involved in cell wall biosynthesis